MTYNRTLNTKGFDMAIPDFQKIMLPLLKKAADVTDFLLRDFGELLANDFNLSEAERAEVLPSGGQTRFINRVSWAAIYLYKAGLLERVKRGHYKISHRGRKVLKEGPEEINIKFLSRYQEFIDFHKHTKKDDSNGESTVVESTPEEALESAHQALKEGLAIDIIQAIKQCSPEFFERLVIDVLVKMGYGGSRKEAGQAVGKAGDGGIDGIIKEDRLGLDIIYIQAKRWEGMVGRPQIQGFVGALAGKHAQKGIFITTSAFTKDAADYVHTIDKKIILIDGPRLADLMIEHNVGTTTIANYEVKRIDTDYFSEE